MYKTRRLDKAVIKTLRKNGLQKYLKRPAEEGRPAKYQGDFKFKFNRI